MNHERQEPPSMDERLRSYAGHRRGVLGERLDMPAPMRERLHREIRLGAGRSRGKPPPGWRLVLSILRPPWAFGTVAVLLLAVGFVWTRLPEPGAEVALGNVLETVPPEPPLPAAAPASATVPAPAPTQPRRAAFHTAPDQDTGDRARASAPPLVMTPAKRAVSRDAAASSAGQPSVQGRYSQRAPGSSTPVLDWFRIEQAGDGFRIVDEDGSVYRAQLRVAPVSSPSGPALSAHPAVTRSVAGAAPQAFPQVIAVNALGTNRGLQQRVTLTGNLVVTNLVGAPPLENQAALLTNQAALRFLFSNAHLEGRVTVGSTNDVPILAVPSER